MTKLLILSSDTGEGHNSAAAAIEAAALSAGLQARIRKPIEESTKVIRSLGSLYNFLLTHRPQAMGWYFKVIDAVRPNERNSIYKRVRRIISDFIRSENPDVVLSVHPMLNHFIPRLVKEQGLPIACFSLLTDPFPPFWRGWSSPYIDRYFVPTEESGEALAAAGVAPARIEQIPMPVRREFAPPAPEEIWNLRQTLHLNGASVIAVNAGARGGGPILNICRTVRRAAPDAGILALCGTNQRLRAQIDQMRDPGIRTFGFLKDIHRYLSVADLIITKPGALSTFEALACRVPVLLTALNVLMPQESGLFQAASVRGFGYSASTFDDLERIIRMGPKEWARKRDFISQFFMPDYAGQLIERICPLHARA